MPSSSSPRFTVDVTFSSGGEPYASEPYIVPAEDETEACEWALRLCCESVYHDPRIPDLAITALARSAQA